MGLQAHECNPTIKSALAAGLSFEPEKRQSNEAIQNFPVAAHRAQLLFKALPGPDGGSMGLQAHECNPTIKSALAAGLSFKPEKDNPTKRSRTSESRLTSANAFQGPSGAWRREHGSSGP